MEKGQIRITPDTALVDEEVKIRLIGFEPLQKVTVRATMDSMPGVSFEATSYAVFQADQNGEIDVTRQSPFSGTYTTIDAMGLFWSMNVSNVQYRMAQTLAEVDFYPRSTTICFTAEVDDQVVAKANFIRRYISPEIEMRPIMENGIAAAFFYNPNANPAPGIIVLGGGEGGLGPQLQFAALFASHGFPALALPYFRFQDLPEKLQEIPLEYFATALEWMQNHPLVKDDEIALFGRSKGAELALLLGSEFPQIKAVIASSPSSVVCIGNIEERDGEFQTYSSWSYHGIPMPCIKWNQEQCSKCLQRLRNSQRIDHIHLSGLLNDEHAEQAVIPVEKIRGPILLISSDDDHWWPATLHSERIVARLKKFHFPFRYQNLNYSNTGHVIRFPYIPTTQLTMNGGTPKNNAHASADSWEQIIKFLYEVF